MSKEFEYLDSLEVQQRISRWTQPKNPPKPFLDDTLDFLEIVSDHYLLSRAFFELGDSSYPIFLGKKYQEKCEFLANFFCGCLIEGCFLEIRHVPGSMIGEEGTRAYNDLVDAGYPIPESLLKILNNLYKKGLLSKIELDRVYYIPERNVHRRKIRSRFFKPNSLTLKSKSKTLLALRLCHTLFVSERWAASMGGRAWGDIASLAIRYLSGEILPFIFIEMCITTAHNNGPCLNKVPWWEKNTRRKLESFNLLLTKKRECRDLKHFLNPHLFRTSARMRDLVSTAYYFGRKK